MPFLIPVVMLGLGFTGGVFASEGVAKLTRLAVLAGAGYLIYKAVR